MLWLLLACEQPSAEPSAAEKAEMMARYTEALSAEDVAGCLTLTDPLSTECAVGIAQKQATEARLDAASQTCAALPEGKGRDECAFQVVDTAKLSGQQAVSLCAVAGRFEKDCINHAASREVEERILRYAAAGNERMVLQQVYATLRKYTDDSSAWIMSQDMVSRWIGRRWPAGTPMSRSVCGDVGPDICAKVYTLKVLGEQGIIDRNAPWRSACRAPLTQQVAQEHGLPLWDNDMSPTVRNAWVLLCSM